MSLILEECSTSGQVEMPLLKLCFIVQIEYKRGGKGFSGFRASFFGCDHMCSILFGDTMVPNTE